MAKQKSQPRIIEAEPVDDFNRTIQTVSAMAIARPEAIAAPVTATELQQIADAYTINSPAVFQMAAGDLSDIVAKRKALDAKRDELVRPLNGVVKQINDLFRGPIEAATGAEKTLRGKMLAYQVAEDERIAEEKRKAEEAQRIERDKAAQLLRDAEEAERAAAATGNVAEMLKASEAVEEAAVMADLAEVAPPALARAPVRASGFGVAKIWQAEVNDIRALQVFVGEHEEYTNLTEPVQSALTALAKATKGALKIPGVRFFDAPISRVTR